MDTSVQSVTQSLKEEVSCLEAQDIWEDPHPDAEAERAYRKHIATCRGCHERQLQTRLAQATTMEA